MANPRTIAATRGGARWRLAPEKHALAELLGPAAESALSYYRGEVGLALSGGGFRASFFPLGVLAQLFGPAGPTGGPG